MHTSKAIVVAAVAAGIGMLCGPTTRAEDWTFFRGPQYNGVSEEADWQAAWPPDGPEIAWRKELGIGASSFTVSGDRVLTMGNQDDQDIVYCLDPADGSAHWTYTYACELNKRQFEGGPAATPTIDGDRVYTLSWDGQLHCLDLGGGRLVWRKHLVDDFGGDPPKWKYAGSPLVQGNMLLLDVGGRGTSTLALDKRTGRKLWSSGNDTPGYASPIPFTQGTQPAIMVFKAKHLVAYRLAGGEELWRFPWETAWDVNASCPIVLGDTFFVSSGYAKGRGALYRLTDDTPRQVWVNDGIKTKMSTCAPHDGFVFGITEKGAALQCIDLATGQTTWEERGFGRFGTLIIAGGRIVALTESGALVIVEANGEAYRELSRAEVLDGRCWVNPVLANGRIYAKTNNGQMVCVDVRGK